MTSSGSCPGSFTCVGTREFDAHIESDDFVGSPAITVTRMVEQAGVVVAEGIVRTQRKNGPMETIAFCDLFELADGRIQKLTSYLVPTTSDHQ